jgi:tagatose-6-phosphate ketose/aldose isomerase
MTNALHELALLPKKERIERGLEYTPKEIEVQPALWLNNIESIQKRENEIRTFVESNIMGENREVILMGAGSSSHVGLSAQNLLKSKWSLDCAVIPTTDLITHYDSLLLKKKKYTFISFARSGNSPESLGAYVLVNRFCDRPNHIVITCNKEGELAKHVSRGDETLLIDLLPETNDKGLAMTSSFTSMLMTAQFLAYIQDVKEYRMILSNLSRSAKVILEEFSDELADICKLNFNRAVFLGSGPLFGSATESQLKLQEMTSGNVICKADTFMGVRHGPRVVIDDKTLVVYFLSGENWARKYELDLIKQIHGKKQGLLRVVVCEDAGDDIEQYVDYAINFSKSFSKKGQTDIPDLCRPILDVLVGQLLGLFKSVSLGLKPDNPSESGVIARVVEGVKIYDIDYFQKCGRFRVMLE